MLQHKGEGKDKRMRQRKIYTFIYLSADFQVFLSKVHGLVMVPQCSVGISKTPACTALPNPALKNKFQHIYRGIVEI